LHEHHHHNLHQASLSHLPKSSGFCHGILLVDVSGDSRVVYIVVDLLETLELLKISLDDEELNDQLEGEVEDEPEEDPVEDLGIGQLKAE